MNPNFPAAVYIKLICIWSSITSYGTTSGHFVERSIDLTVAEDEACTNAKCSRSRGKGDDLGGTLECT